MNPGQSQIQILFSGVPIDWCALYPRIERME